MTASRKTDPHTDVIVIGAGAAGMMAAATAGRRGLRVVLIDHAQRLAEKIRISGGGRCNFTNLGASPAQYLSRNPHFCRSALAAYTPRDFIDLISAYGVRWHEKHRGQLFCNQSSEDIIGVLKAECDAARVVWRMPCSVQAIEALQPGFALHTSQGRLTAANVVLATGGMAIPQLGATDFALRIARQFGLKIVEPRPALVPLTFDAEAWKPFGELSGVALEVAVSTQSEFAPGARRGTAPMQFHEDLLFTHRGLSGPAILQISSYWNPGEPVTVDLAPGQDLACALIQAKAGSRQQLATVVAGLWPKRLSDVWLGAHAESSAGAGTGRLLAGARAASDTAPGGGLRGDQRLADVSDKALRALADRIHGWSLVPTGTAGYKKAEVMRGGVDTAELNQKTLEARDVPGLYVIGEAVDVTGWLGGYNFQWAWASGVACGRAVQAQAVAG